LAWAGTDYPWASAQIVGLLGFAAVMLALLLVVERRAAQPIIDLRFFRNGIYSVSMVSVFLVSIGMFGAVLYLPLFMQAVIGTSATNSGVALTPMMLGFIVSAIVSGQVLARTRRYKVAALTMFAIGIAGAVLLSCMGPSATEGLAIRNMVIIGLGVGGLMSLYMIVVQNVFPTSDLGQVSANLQFFRSLGGTMGAAVLGSVMTNRYQAAMQTNLPEALTRAVSAERLEALQNPQALLAPEATERIREAFAAMGADGDDLFRQLMEAMRVSLSDAITGLFVFSAATLALGLLVTLFLKEVRLRRTHGPEPVAEEPGRSEPPAAEGVTAPSGEPAGSSPPDAPA
jgi:MFS family permease